MKRTKEEISLLKEISSSDGYVLYRIPSIHKVGITNDLYQRIRHYDRKGVDTSDWRVINRYDDIGEAMGVEVRMQGELCFFGAHGIHHHHKL